MGHIATCMALASAMAIAAPTIAGNSLTPNLRFTVGSDSGTFVFDAAAAGNSWMNGNGTFGFTGSSGPANDAPSGFRLDWNMLVSPEPFMVGNVVVTNTTTVTQAILVQMTLAVGSPLPFTLVGGSISGAVTDLTGNGASLSSIGTSPIYTGFTDFGFGTQSTAAALMSSATITAGTNQSASIGPAGFGGIFPSKPNGAVLENITVQFHFTLSAGDSASFTSIFDVQAIPAPGVLALLGAAGAVRSRRRR